MLNVTSFRDANEGQMKKKIVGWNVPRVANGSIANASVYHSESLFSEVFLLQIK